MEALLQTVIGPAYLRVQIDESDLDAGPQTLWRSVFHHATDTIATNQNSTVPTRAIRHDQERLAKAQRILACREILSILANEASGLNPVGRPQSDSISFSVQQVFHSSLSF